MSQAHAFFETHQSTLLQADAANRSREFWSPYPEAPSGRVYGENAAVDGESRFQGYLGKPFELAGIGALGEVAEEVSPYGIDLGVRYQRPDTEALITRMQDAMGAWREAGPDLRAGVCLEILHRLNRRSFEMAHAVMHTTGQGFVMAFQAGGPHAQDRGLEAVAQTWSAMKAVPDTARWVKPQGKNPPITLDKRFHIVPRGIGLVVACATFPTWNTYPGLFASLVAGNPVLVKPHPGAVLPLAISVQVAQQVLAEAGFDPCLVSLVPDSRAEPVTRSLAQHPAVRLIDFTGSSAFGDWLEANCPQAEVFTEKAGVNCLIIDSVDSMKAVARNLSMSLSLYSGQMCTTPQAIYIPRDGIDSAEGRLGFDDVAEQLAGSIEKFTSNTEVAVHVLGAIQSEETRARIEASASLGEVVLPSRALVHPEYPAARIRTPLLLKVDAADIDAYGEERFGPISFLVATDDTDHSLALAQQVIAGKGAITLGVYSTDEAVLDKAEALAIDARVALSCNFTGGFLVNQSAAFGDFHATGGNPAANASLTDSAFVSRRFVVVQSRREVAAPQA
ncbi:phenylacetic acid degradation oxidoreductase [Marinobacterium nitratireducens]|uniref:Phenylacetic acid degradation oxidoreductase n=1 Tax=Marinobacterium nitratireducens TaxID=518897 RepID=A0A917ZAF8_9GAMM|nr:phenylacetic acid degradation protein PaaN [Marinobacterium nitratireducens]GGO79150.1 phenylacetic acid degradation oxidoreductase [Marinobacterium nitratireducens]